MLFFVLMSSVIMLTLLVLFFIAIFVIDHATSKTSAENHLRNSGVVFLTPRQVAIRELERAKVIHEFENKFVCRKKK